MWAWLIMDYTTSEENGHWKCKLTSDMFLCGERKNRNLTLFCIPNFVMKCLTCLFGSKEYPDDGSGESSNSSCCKKCTYISSVFLVPLALVLGVLGKIFFYQVMFSRKFSWIPICRHRNRQLHFFNINVFLRKIKISFSSWNQVLIFFSCDVIVGFDNIVLASIPCSHLALHIGC